MAIPSDYDPARLESDFLSGKNPLAYIPLCNALRKQKKYSRALEICHRGLAGDPESVAGRVIYARLLGDSGRYQDALAEIQRVENKAPDALGLMVEKAKCLIHLRRIEEARATLDELDKRNPFDPQVQMLETQYRQVKGQQQESNQRQSRSSGHRRLKLRNQEILDRILAEMRSLADIISCAVVPIRAGDPALHGTPEPAECAYEFYKEAMEACGELDCGGVEIGLIETENSQLIVLVRREHLVSFSMRPTANFGKVLYRLQMAVSRLLPGPKGRIDLEETRDQDENETLVEE